LLDNTTPLAAPQITITPSAPVRLWGHVAKIQGQSLIIKGLNAFAGLGALIEIESPDGRRVGEIISLEAYLCEDAAPRPSESWIGHCLDYKGETNHAVQPACGTIDAPLMQSPPPAILRKALGERLKTGVAAIDCFPSFHRAHAWA